MGKKWREMIASWEAEGNICYTVEIKGYAATWVLWGPRRGEYTRINSGGQYRTTKSPLPEIRLAKIGKFDWASSVAKSAANVLMVSGKDYMYAWRLVRKYYNQAIDKIPAMARYMANILKPAHVGSHISGTFLKMPETWHVKPTKKNVRALKIDLIKTYLKSTKIIIGPAVLPEGDGEITDAMAINVFNLSLIGLSTSFTLLPHKWAKQEFSLLLLKLAYLWATRSLPSMDASYLGSTAWFISSTVMIEDIYTFCLKYRGNRYLQLLVSLRRAFERGELWTEYAVSGDKILETYLEMRGERKQEKELTHFRVWEHHRVPLCYEKNPNVKRSIYYPTLDVFKNINLYISESVCPDCAEMHDKLVAAGEK